jgi:hypothetical protein
MCVVQWQLSYNLSLSMEKIPQDLLPLAAYFKDSVICFLMSPGHFFYILTYR